LDDSEAAVAIIYAQNRDPLQAEFGVNVARQRVTLQAVVLNVGEVPRDNSFWNRRISRGAVHQWRLCLQSNSQSNVGCIAADRSKHGPDLLVVNHFDDLIAGRAPHRGIVVYHQLERLATVPARCVRFLNGQDSAVEHAITKSLIRMVVKGADKADPNLSQVFQVGTE